MFLDRGMSRLSCRLMRLEAALTGLELVAVGDDGEIHKKRGDTQVGTLRKTYGEDFATGRRSDMRLDTLLKQAGVDTLDQVLKKRRR